MGTLEWNGNPGEISEHDFRWDDGIVHDEPIEEDEPTAMRDN